MRVKLRQQYSKILKRRKQKIERRLKRKQWEEQESPMFSGRNIHYEVAEKSQAINCGGIGAIHQMVQRSGLADAIEERGKCDEDAGKGFGKQLGIHGNSVAGVESEGMVWVVDAEYRKGNTGSENGVQTVSEHLDIIAVSDTQDRQKDRVSFAWIQ